ncbi:MAG: NAD(P)-dependent alcohol dehydrogenase [Mycetocola sp.]
MKTSQPAAGSASAHVDRIPLTMPAAVYRRFGPPDVVSVENVPTPKPGPDEILVRVMASTVSIADHRARSRSVPHGLRLLAALGLGFFRPRHHILGMDAAGVVETVGADVTQFVPGDEVIAMLGGRWGGHGAFVCVKADSAVTAKPHNMTFEQAVTLVFGGSTARGFLNQVDITRGDSVLVNGASGAVGSAVVQLAKELGARVTAVCSGAKAGLVESLGADRVIDYRTGDLTADGESYDVIVDCAGTAGFERVGASIRPGGALLLVVTDLRGMVQAAKRSRTSGKLVTFRVGEHRAEDLAYLVDLAESGRYRPVIDRTYDLADVVDAHRYVDAGHKTGNVVLRVSAGQS